MSLSVYSAKIPPDFLFSLSSISLIHVSKSTFRGSVPRGSEMFFSPYLIYGPNLPFVQTISIPLYWPTVLGNSKSFRASSRVMLSMSCPGARLAYCFCSPSPFWTYGPYCPKRAMRTCPSLGSTPSSRLMLLYYLLLRVSRTLVWNGP